MATCSCSNGCRPHQVTFHELLQQLADAHDAEVKALRDTQKPDENAFPSQVASACAILPIVPIESVATVAEPESPSDDGYVAAVGSSLDTGPTHQSKGKRGSVQFTIPNCSDDFGYVNELDDFSSCGKNRKSRKSMSSAVIDGTSRLTSPLSGAQTFDMTYTYYQRVCYIVDTWISKRRSQGIALAGACFLAIIAFGLVWTLVFPLEDAAWRDSFFEGMWVAWTFMADPGTHADERDPARRMVGSMIAAVGILFMAATLGMVVDVIRDKMEALRQGKSSVAERDHTLILGWTEKAVSIIEELCTANESAGGGTIVVLCSQNKEHIEREFALQLPHPRRLGTRIVFRSGNTMVISDLMKVGAPTARATIILANDGDPDNSDAETLRTVLSLRTLPYKLKGHVVAEVRDIDNEPLVKMVGGTLAETLVSHDVLGRLMLMSARQPGLAKVYESLLGFDGDEFYMREWPDLVGLTFGELIERFPDAVPIGICTAGGMMLMNPNPNRQLRDGEQVFVLAEDDDTYKPEEPVEIEEGDAPADSPKRLFPEKILFCGWRRDIRDIVMHLDSILQAGSEIHMISSLVRLEKRTEVLLEEGLDVSELKRVRLVHHYGNPSVRRRLSALPLGDFDSCMIFSDQAFEKDTMHADSHSLATLLLLRDLQSSLKDAQQRGSCLSRMSSFQAVNTDSMNELAAMKKDCPVICEVLDSRTQKTINSSAYMRQTSEFCQTNKITAQILAMVAENRSISVLFDELLGTRGNSVNVHSAFRYVERFEEVSFWTIAKRASKKQETLIGYITRAEETVCLNPCDKDQLCFWDDYDMIVISRSDALHQASTSQLLEEASFEEPGELPLDSEAPIAPPMLRTFL